MVFVQDLAFTVNLLGRGRSRPVFAPEDGALRVSAPGFGRWTKFLIPACDEFVGIDLSAKCVDACREIFASARHAQFIANDGFSLDAAPDGKFDLVFSFDSLVHGEYDVMASYIPQVLRKLSANGVAFLHHSNLLAYGNTIGAPHGRAMTVSADVVDDLVKRADGAVLVQEIINWGCDHLIDCLTLLARRDAYASAKPVRLKNPLYMAEAALIRNFQNCYNGSVEYSTPDSKTAGATAA